MKVAVIGGGNAATRLVLSFAALGRAMIYTQPSAMGKSERNPQLEDMRRIISHAGPVTYAELTAALPPSDDPFKPCRRSKGEKARNRKQRRG